MSLKDIEKMISFISDNADEADFDGAKPESLINSAEFTLKICFPPSYRMFLEKLGCGGIYGQEFYGLIRDDFINSGIPDAVWITLQERKESKLPENLVIIYSGGDGSYCALDCRDVENAPVVEWEPGCSNGNLKIISNDFGSFFKDIILEMKN